jgi:hypothetical protein
MTDEEFRHQIYNCIRMLIADEIERRLAELRDNASSSWTWIGSALVKTK